MKFKKCLALLLALLMVLSLAACNNPGAENTDQQPSASNSSNTEPESPPAEEGDVQYMPNAPTYEPTDGEKYTVELTADGWYKIVNDGGATLGLHPNSGVHLVEADGYAFKDMNQNGQLDPYEDWRLSTEERTENLVSLMKGEEKAAILSHGGWGSITTDLLTSEDTSYTYLIAGGRGGVTRSISAGGADHAQWTNSIQAVAESCYYGIPAMISIDPANISGLIECVALGSTMDPDLAAQVGIETSRQYRAAGVTALLGPQVDIASPVMQRGSGTYGEDPQLTLDIATAYVNAMQSTYENGQDQGWGDESVFCFTKHYGGAGATEGGRDDHSYTARYAVFPGDNLEAHLITYFDGVFDLPGKTGSSGIMTQYSINVGPDGEPYGGEWSGAYNSYMYGLLDEYGYDSLKITDWGVFNCFGSWGTESIETEPERIALGWERGVELLGGYGTQASVTAAYPILVSNVGQAEADAIIDHAAGNYIEVMMNLNMFDNPYNDSAYADSILFSDSSKAFGLETQRESVVMIKNDGTISANAVSGKPTVYVPYSYNTNFSVSAFGGISEGTPSWGCNMNLDILGNYFNIVTDSVPEDATGHDDVVRATADEIAACDYILVGMSNPYAQSYPSNMVSTMRDYQTNYLSGALCSDEWFPVTLQYSPYTADTAREVSLSGLPMEDGSRENRSYKGNTATVANYGDLEALEYAASVAGDIPVIVSMKMERGMVWSEVEPLADVILVSYQSQKNEVVAEIILGQTEPNGLLVFQQPVDMEAVEAQLDDVPRDMKCYVDANGNTYDFAFGLNWSGVINDSRVQTYSAAPITKIQNLDYSAYAAANK